MVKVHYIELLLIEFKFRFQHIPATNEDIFDYGLFLIQVILSQFGKPMANFPPMPSPTGIWEAFQAYDNYLLWQEFAYDPADVTLKVKDRLNTFNFEQHTVLQCCYKDQSK